MAKKKKKAKKKKDRTREVAKDIQESAHKVWLAGLGAFAIAEEEGGKLLRALMRKGEEMEKRVQPHIDAARTKATETAGAAKRKAEAGADKVGKTLDKLGDVVEEKVSGAIGKMGVPSRDEVDALNAQIAELKKTVADLQKGGAAKKPARRKPAAKKAARKPARKAAKKTAKKAAKKTTRKPAKKAAKTTARKTAKKTTRKPAAKKTTRKPAKKTT